MKPLKLALIVLGLLGLSACAKKHSSFSILSVGESFRQNTASDTKIDILWILDGSATMANHQDNLAHNFDHFINQFVDKELDYHMVVASTDAWVREFDYNAGTCASNPNPSMDPNTIYQSSADCKVTGATFGQLTHFRDGDIYGPIGGSPISGGVFLLTGAMNPVDVKDLFSINIKTGTRGDGVREAGLQSLRSVLRRNEDGSVGYNGETHTALDSFRRDDAFFAVIVVSDEEDQSIKMDGTPYSSISEYSESFTQFLDGYTQSFGGEKHYSVSGIVLEDKHSCPYGLNSQVSQGDKYLAMAEATNGIIGDICSADFSQDLNNIASKIISLATRFRINGEPVPESIKVLVNGVGVPKGSIDGWTYIVENEVHYIQFNGEAVPPQGASISVSFDPKKLQF